MPCGYIESDCAHEASKYLQLYFPVLNAKDGTHQRVVNGLLRCGCGLVLRAKELFNWAKQQGKIVNALGSGLYLVYEENTENGQGHVYVIHNHQKYGNGNYNWDKSKYRVYIQLK
ncbi:hypothetical protein TTHERM_00117560 (macronuclear) [Tetrahymena thermophila SB210]|uniref:Uncharacterized protein n=1 Tax=Tetrahymena thermophila (strain SB210) TaxID=312017 RepID=Q22Z11_TETTS|nr:hypothetical protein TTHERM_00117560 [Tetrahymena thermophila SB210]EAR90510.1 hypothetical protein TTHERM_00117560 [Tetrahymena thermophila SB210]|eukprot:XP_001010755.1 hypothetical protein TTHERM_00117560 [Tetrahymena thermophila SB210]